MDPRLNPNLTPAPRLVQDIHSIEGPNLASHQESRTNPPPKQASILPRASTLNSNLQNIPVAHNPQLSTTELVGTIPMHLPDQIPISPGQTSAPRVQMPGYSQHQNEPEDDLDKILQAVNSRVQSPQASSQPKPKKPIFSKLSTNYKKIKPLTATNKPVMAMTVVIFIALALSIVAIMAYSQGQKSSALARIPGKVGTSYTAGSSIQAAGGTLVRPSDLDDYSQTLSNKLNNLNDSQDFESASLSDAVLGL